jgi:SAM-dependent methyltransferase
MSLASFPWPGMPGGERPEWTGRGFRVGDRTVPVLDFVPETEPAGPVGWTDELTSLHEDTAGQDHPIDRASRSWALRGLRRHLSSDTGTILEVGCSSGYLLTDLRQGWSRADVIASDVVLASLRQLAIRLPDVAFLRFDVTACPLPDASVDAVVMLNVLEHVDDDAGAVAAVARILRPGGVLILEIPAGPRLYDAYDRYLQHRRRYAAGTVRQLVRAAGLEILEETHHGFLAYAPFALVKLRNRRALSADIEIQREVVSRSIRGTSSSRLLRILLSIEAMVSPYVALPCGIRYAAVCRKPAAPVESHDGGVRSL